MTLLTPPPPDDGGNDSRYVLSDSCCMCSRGVGDGNDSSVNVDIVAADDASDDFAMTVNVSGIELPAVGNVTPLIDATLITIDAVPVDPIVVTADADTNIVTFASLTDRTYTEYDTPLSAGFALFDSLMTTPLYSDGANCSDTVVEFACTTDSDDGADGGPTMNTCVENSSDDDDGRLLSLTLT